MKSKTSQQEQVIHQGYHKVVLSLSPLQKVSFDKICEELDMNGSQLFEYLIQRHYTFDLSTIRMFRYNLVKRVKKGINNQYIKEFIKLNNYLNTFLENL
jgi:hypothetical protein